MVMATTSSSAVTAPVTRFPRTSPTVLKVYRCLRKTDEIHSRQLVFYDPGVGTLERPNPWHKLKQDFNAILGLATGYGLDDSVLAAYSFLVHTYQAGDQIYLFGFSRGAYTVRVLAG